MKEDPCINCLIKACCSIPCEDHAEYILINKKYPETVQEHIKGMSHNNALAHILAVETIWFAIRTIT
jgi:hypothetical protein